MLSGVPCFPFNARGGNNVIHLSDAGCRWDQTESDRWHTCRATEGALFRLFGCFLLWDTFRLLRIEGKLWNREMNAKWFYVIFLIHFLGELGFPWHPWIHATVYLVNYLINGCNIVGCIWYQLCIYVNRVGLQNISERFWNIIVLQSVGIVWS